MTTNTTPGSRSGAIGTGTVATGSAGSAMGSRRTITAFFDNRAEADRAVDKLVAAGFSRDAIRLVAGNQGAAGSGASVSSTTSEHSGFWEALKDLFLPDEDRYTYAEGLRRGGFLITVTSSDANYQKALQILDEEGTINMDEREASWRSQGWSGYSAGALSGGGGATTGTGIGATTARTGTGAGLTGATTGSTGLAAGREEAIPVVEEQLRVGKREVGHGAVRVRSYVVETPVQEQVNLRQEHVTVERRPVDRPLTGNEKLFQDRTIEVLEKAEEAVISKEARVKEELVVKKDVEERTKTVSDTVRRTEVEVEDERTGAIRAGERKPR